MNNEELWLVEWSDSQKAFHVDSIKPGPYRALNRLLDTGSAGDWTVLAACKTMTEANRICEELKPIVRD